MYPTLTNRSDVLKMLEEMIQIRQKILDSCATLAAEQLNDPVYPGTWSVLKNLAHLAWAENFMMSCVKCRPSAAEKSALTPEPALEPAAVRTGFR